MKDYLQALMMLSWIIPVGILRWYYRNRKSYNSCSHVSDGVLINQYTSLTSMGGHPCTSWVSHCKKCGHPLYSIKGYVDGQPNHVITIELSQ